MDTVKCDPGMILSNGAEELFIIVTWSDRKLNFSLLATNEPKWWFGCLLCYMLESLVQLVLFI